MFIIDLFKTPAIVPLLALFSLPVVVVPYLISTRPLTGWHCCSVYSVQSLFQISIHCSIIDVMWCHI